jgi:aspartate carbamoyltransferase regulatory subunit
MEVKTLQVSAIENGTVIDHIPSKVVFRVARILLLDEYRDLILIGTGLESKKLPSKGIIKIKDKFLDKEEVNKIALIAPEATHIVIRNYQITEKTTVTIPDVISGITKCVNPNCITNMENVKTKFDVISKLPLKMRCRYCEKIMDKKDLNFY